MTWDERWRREERPDASEIPDDYGVIPKGRGKIIIGYFVGLYVLYYVALKLFGAQGELITGYPVLMWLAGILIFLTLIGMYVLVWRPGVRAKEDEVRDADQDTSTARMEGD